MKWKRVSEYGMQSGPYKVAKVFLDGATLYGVSHDSQEKMLKWCADWEQAQEYAKEHKEGKHES